VSGCRLICLGSISAQCTVVAHVLNLAIEQIAAGTSRAVIMLLLVCKI
jgi:hypothetical protein